MSARLFIPRLSSLRGLKFFPGTSLVTKPILPVSRSLSSSPTRVALTDRPARHGASLHPRRFSSPSPASTSRNPMADLPADASLSQRLKHLMKSYGWYALGVYLVIGVIDFSVAFAAINLLGAEQVSRVAQSAKDYIASAIHHRPDEPGKQEFETASSSGHEGLYAMAVLAYTVHKTLFMPLRLGLTAAMTPRLVGWLRMRGWAGGAGTMRAAREMRDRVNRNRT